MYVSGQISLDVQITEAQSSLKGIPADSQQRLPHGHKHGSRTAGSLLGSLLPKSWSSEEYPEIGGPSDSVSVAFEAVRGPLQTHSTNKSIKQT